MLISFLLRVALIYVLWTLGKRVWRNYQMLKHAASHGTGAYRKANPTDASKDVVDAEFRVINERD